MIIDFENHLFMEEQLEKGSSKSGKIIEHFWDANGMVGTRKFKEASHIERYLDFMDEAGIDMAVLTTNFVSGLEQMKRWNDFCAKVVKENPKRFIGFACIPPLGGPPAFEELERAVKELGLKGVHIWTWTEGRPLDSRELWPFYAKVSDLGVPIDVHVTQKPPGFESLNADYGLYFTIARELDMCASTLRVCLGGVLEDFPNLVLIMNHFGGGISSILERLDSYMRRVGPSWPSFYLDKPHISRPWREYFDKLYFNMAGRESGIASVKCALTNINPRRLVFATDWPFNYEDNPQEVRQYVEEIRKLDIPLGSAEAMLGGNAAKLLGI